MKTMKSFRVFSLSVLFTLLSGLAMPGFADDIEIYSDAYYGSEAGTIKPNILFMLDNSRSMAWPVGINSEEDFEKYLAGDEDIVSQVEDPRPRLNILTEAMLGTMTEVKDIANIGVGRFLDKDKNAGSKRDSNAPIILPVAFFGDSDEVFEIAKTTSATIRHSQDDAMEYVSSDSSNGEMDLTSATLFASGIIKVTVGSTTYQIELVSNTDNTWKYRIEEIHGDGGDLTSWVLDLAESCNISNPVSNQSSKTELKTDLTKGIGWDITNTNFSGGDFTFTLDGDYPGTLVDVKVNGITVDQIAGPNCGAAGGGGETSGPQFDPNSTIIEDGANQFKVSLVGVTNSGRTWTYKAESLQGDPLKRWHLSGPEGTETSDWWQCHLKATTIGNGGRKYTGGKPKGIRWLTTGEVSFTLDKKYPVGYIQAWGGTQSTDRDPKPRDYMKAGNNPIFGPLCEDTVEKTVTTCVQRSSEGSCTQTQTVDYEISLLNFDNNLWKYRIKLKNSGDQKILNDWRFTLPEDCVDKLGTTSPRHDALLSGKKIKWEVSDNFAQGDFSFTLEGDAFVALNGYNYTSYLAGEATGDLREINEGKSNTFNIVGPGTCELPEEHEPTSCQVVNDDGKKMTICHIPYGNPENAHTIEISKNAWPAHQKGGDTVGQCAQELFNEDESINETVWDSIPSANGKSGKQKKITLCHTAKGVNPHSITISQSAVKTHLSHHMDTIGDCDDGPEIECPEGGDEGQTSSGKQLVGLRFEHVDVPQGAKILGAKIHFQSAGKAEGSATFVINAEDSANASSFSDDRFDISQRSTLGDDYNKTWEVGNWYASTTPETPDLSELVQQIVGTNVSESHEWCGGNSLAFIIQGDDKGALHRAWSADGDPSSAPRLEIQYETSSDAVGCIKQSAFMQIADQNDDAEEVSGGNVFVESPGQDKGLELGWGEGGYNDQRTVGLRFRNTPFGKEVQIESAHLIVQADAVDNSSNANFVIKGELAAPDSVPFAEDNFNVSGRDKVKNEAGDEIGIDWSVKEEWEHGKLYWSPDIAEIVQAMVNQPNWDKSDSMTFFITGTGQRKAFSFEAGSSKAAWLHVQVNGFVEDLSAIDKVEHEILKQMNPNELEVGTETPIVDALYEAAMYYTNGPVTYGQDREGYNRYLISAPETYQVKNGNDKVVARPAICDAEPFNMDCKNEKIPPGAKPEYVSPLSACQSSNHIVLLTEGAATANQSFEDNRVAPFIGDNCQYKWDQFDENMAEKCGISLAKYLYETDHLVEESDDRAKNNIATHTVGFLLPEGEQHTVDFLKKMAEQGGGNYNPVNDIGQLKEVLKQMIISISEETSSFAPSGVSVNRFNQLVHEEEVYYALFKHTKRRAWEGNIKKYRMASVLTTHNSAKHCSFVTLDDSDTEVSCLVDQNGNPALDEDLFSDNAQSFWSDEVDGSAVTKGGAGEQLLNIDVTQRQILTYIGNYPSGSKTALTHISDVSTATLSNSGLNGQSLAEAELESYQGTITTESLVDWILGTNRTWLMAEPLHSTPQAISYAPDNEDGTENGLVFVGTNDGLVRAIDAETGVEKWAYLPQEMLDRQAALMVNSSDIDLTNHIYGVDATPMFWINDRDDIITADDGDFVYMFIGTRRGGKNLYALDVTDTDNPEMLWAIKGGDGDFARLGQTWSLPKPVKVRDTYCKAANAELEADNSCVVLLFGGGYDDTQDGTDSPNDTYGQVSDGNAIYMVHAKTGQRIWWASSQAGGVGNLSLAEMKYAIPSDLTVLDIDGDGWQDRIYVGDLGGQVWRIDLLGQQLVNGQYEDQTLGGRLADFSDNTEAGKRRFFYRPDWSPVQTEQHQTIDVVAIVSGNRAHPRLDVTTQDRVYVFQDTGWKVDQAGNKQLTTITESDMDDVGADELEGTLPWYLTLPRQGEKGLSSPLISKDSNLNKEVLYFTTYVPSIQEAGTCVFKEGNSFIYAVDLLTAKPAYDKDPPSDCPEGGCPETLDPDEEGDEPEDRAIPAGQGIQTGAQTQVNKDGSKPTQNNQSLAGGEDSGLKRTFWLEVDN